MAEYKNYPWIKSSDPDTDHSMPLTALRISKSDIVNRFTHNNRSLCKVHVYYEDMDYTFLLNAKALHQDRYDATKLYTRIPADTLITLTYTELDSSGQYVDKHTKVDADYLNTMLKDQDLQRDRVSLINSLNNKIVISADNISQSSQERESRHIDLSL